jgi:hypothetical protein
MKRIVSLLGGLVVGAVVFGSTAGFVAYNLAHVGEPSVIVRNLTKFPITQVRIETDVGESYALNEIAAAESRRAQISGGDKLVWVVATTSTGETRESEHIYVTSHGTVFAAVTEQSITIDYEL